MQKVFLFLKPKFLDTGTMFWSIVSKDKFKIHQDSELPSFSAEKFIVSNK